MHLYHSPTSPFVRKVMVTLIETGQLEDVEVVTVATTPVKTDTLLKASFGLTMNNRRVSRKPCT